ncbi:MAG: poly(R)-hydroxyalkanoic acid synthase subunit PhaE [Cellvibrionaceae bacterium]
MAQDSNAIWQELMASWQNSQQQAAEQMLKGFEQWNATAKESGINVSNPVLDTYQSLAQAFFKNYSSIDHSGFSQNWEQYLKGMPSAAALGEEMKKLIESGEKLFESLSGDFLSSLKDDESNQYLLKALMDMSNPNSWLKYSGDNFDISAHKLSEGPLFSGISDIDNRLAQVNDSWLELFDESKKYHSIVFSKWSLAYTKFLDMLNELDKDQRAELSPRKLIDMWATIANEELLTLHRSEEFLSAQRSVIRASMQYRLHEKEVAEVICEALHIPTRDEVDDLHKTVTELRRELRQTKTALNDIHQSLAGQFTKKVSAKEKHR